jgi:uncharacterized membrane protein
MNKSVKIRLWELDFLRGLAVVGMIIFHIFYILNFFDIVQNKMYQGKFFLLAKFVQFTFLGLVGVSLALSKNNYKKLILHGLKIFFMGILVSAVTYFFAPKIFVKFGILHLIGISIIILAPMAHKKYLSFFGGIIAVLIGVFIAEQTSALSILYIVGFNVESLNSIDYFPIFPWIGLILFGIFIGNILSDKIVKYEQKRISLPKIFIPFVVLGRNSLFIYMAHIPVIIAILVIMNVVSIDKIL